MRRALTLRLVLLAALLFTLVRVVIVHSAHAGPIEWLAVAVLVVALLAASVAHPRRAGPP
jgi:hypothetical protein